MVEEYIRQVEQWDKDLKSEKLLLLMESRPTAVRVANLLRSCGYKVTLKPGRFFIFMEVVRPKPK